MYQYIFSQDSSFFPVSGLRCSFYLLIIQSSFLISTIKYPPVCHSFDIFHRDIDR